MKILVYMRDGRTCYLLRNRKQLRDLIGTKPDGEHPSVPAVRGIWNPHESEYVWQRVPLRHVPASSIGVVEEARDGIADAVAMLKPETEETP